jgi:hypothetical protein
MRGIKINVLVVFSGNGCRHWSLESGVCGTGVSPSHTNLQVSLLLIIVPILNFLKIILFWPGELVENFCNMFSDSFERISISENQVTGLAINLFT